MHMRVTKQDLILKLPKWASITAANVVMGWTTVRARVVVQKLSFLHRLVSAERERERERESG